MTTASRVTPAASFVSQNSFDGGPTCCLCLSAPRTVRLGPCGHACLCRECYANMTQQGSKLCPICRTTITSHTASDAVVRELTYLPGFTGSDPAVTNMGVEQGAPPQSSWLWGKKKAIWGAFLLGLASLLAFIIGLTVGNSSTQTQTPIQTPAPSARWAWAGGGCSTASTAHKWTQLNTSLSAAVRCCSVGGIEVTCDSDPSGTCLPAVATYAEAEQACAAAGMRLCSRGEIEDDICCGTGCGYDGHVVWTSKAAKKCGEMGGIPSGDGLACCPASCGTCGGPGCGGLPGGASSCCQGAITKSGQFCGSPPCLTSGLQGAQGLSLSLSVSLSLSLSLCVSSCCVWHTHSCAYVFVCVGSNVFPSLYVCVYVCPLIKCAAHLRVANGERVATHHASSGSWH